MNEIINSLFNRRSTRVFEQTSVSPEIKQLLLECALQAPTAGNQVLYNIIDVTDNDLKEKLANSCDNQPFIATAPLVFIFVADNRRWFRSFDLAGANPRPMGVGDIMLAFSDACIAAQNVVVTAESLGLGSCYIGDILEQCETHRQLLELPTHCIPACMLVLGYPTTEQKARKKPTRIDTKYVVGENRYPQLTDEQIRECYLDQQKRDGKAEIKPFDEYMTAFCKRKYNSDFSKEMTRSVVEYLKDFNEFI